MQTDGLAERLTKWHRNHLPKTGSPIDDIPSMPPLKVVSAAERFDAVLVIEDVPRPIEKVSTRQ